MCTPYSDACRQKCDQMVHHVHSDAHKQHTYTHTQALARRQAQNSLVLISLPVRDQRTSILRGEFVKMFQKVTFRQNRVISVPEVG